MGVIFVNDGDSIQTAIAGANSGDTIFVANGTYDEDLVLKDGVSIVGESEAGVIVTGSLTTPGGVFSAATISHLTVNNDSMLLDLRQTDLMADVVFSDITFSLDGDFNESDPPIGNGQGNGSIGIADADGDGAGLTFQHITMNAGGHIVDNTPDDVLAYTTFHSFGDAVMRLDDVTLTGTVTGDTTGLGAQWNMTPGSGESASVEIINSHTSGGGNFYVSGMDGVLIKDNVFDGQGLALNGVTDALVTGNIFQDIDGTLVANTSGQHRGLVIEDAWGTDGVSGVTVTGNIFQDISAEDGAIAFQRFTANGDGETATIARLNDVDIHDNIFTNVDTPIFLNDTHFVPGSVIPTDFNGEQVIIGTDGDDPIVDASTGDMTIIAGKGDDTISGGAGDTTYYVNGTAAITDAGGFDEVRSTNDFTLDDGIETLTLLGDDEIDGTGNGLDNTITGNGLDNTLAGLDGEDTLVGNGGDDTLDGGDDNDTLQGGVGNDTLEGGAGDDTLDGGDGIDTAEYGQEITTADVSLNAGNWEVEASSTDTLIDVEVISHASGTKLLVGNGGFDTIQAAIDAAAAGDTILIAEGNYTEDLSITKGITLQAVGAVTLTAASAVPGTAITISGDLNGADVTIIGLDIAGLQSIPNTGRGIFVDHGANVGTLKLEGVTVRDGGYAGLFVYADDENSATPTVNTLTELVVTDSDFVNNGYNGSNGGAHIKLFGFTGNATLTGIDITGGSGGVGIGNLSNLPDYGIEITGISNTELTQAPTAGPPIGTITIDNVKVTGDLHKNALAVFNFGNIDGLEIANTDLSGAVTSWGPVFNLDGIASDIDATAFDVTLPAGTPWAAELQGEKADQGVVNSVITGGDANELLNGKTGNDTLDAGAGNDVLLGGDGDDTLEGGTGDDALLGGSGTDTAEYAATLDADDFSLVTDVDPITAGAQAGWQIASGGAEGTDQVTGVEAVDHGGTNNTLLVGNNGYTTIQDAIDAAQDGDTILVAEGTYAGFTVSTDGLIIKAVGDVTIEGALLTDLGVPIGVPLNDFFEANHPAYSQSSGVTIAADGVTLTGFTLTGWSNALELGTSDGVTIEGNTFIDNVTGIRKGTEQNVTGLTVNGNTFTQGIHGLTIYAAENGNGAFDGIEMNGNSFSKLSEKGMYFEQLSNAALDGNTFDDVGNYGRVSPPFGGTDGEFGQAIDINLKYEDYSGVTFTDTTITNSGHSDQDGAGTPGDFGGAIGIKIRDDAPSYNTTPATFTGQITFDGLVIDGTSTGVRVGEPTKNNGGPDVLLTDLTINNATVTDVENATDPAAGGTTTVVLSATQADLDASASQAPVEVTGNDLGNTITTGSGDDAIDSGDGNDVLTGGGGADALTGGDGDDSYFGDAADTIIEASGVDSGTDHVSSDESIVLSANVENLSLTGTDNVDGTGNELANVITGNSGDNTLNGGDGNDTLSGGDGNDTLIGGLGDDTLDGGTGTDTASYNQVLDVANDITFNALDGQWEVEASSTDFLTNVEVIQHNGGKVLLVGGGGGYDSIQDAIDAAQNGDTILLASGTYEENVVVNKDGLTIKSETGDPADVILKGSFRTDNSIPVGQTVGEWIGPQTSYVADAGIGLLIDADDVTIQNITIAEYLYGVRLNTSDGVTIDGVTFDENLIGIYKEDGAANVTDFDLLGGRIEDGYQGVIINAADGGSFADVVIDGTTFEHLSWKGIYAEQLSNAQLINLIMNDVGQFGRADVTGVIGTDGSAIELNVKFDNFSNVTISDFTLTDVGLSNGGGSSHENGAAIAIKARDDAPTYSGDPATLSGVIIENGTINGTSTGIRTGEPGKTNAGPTDVVVTNVGITNETVADYDNRSAATLEVNLSGGDDTATTNPAATGPIHYLGGAGADDITGGPGGDTLEGGNDADTLNGGAGDDALVGGLGDDDLDGGDDYDTATAGDDAIFEHDGFNWTVASSDGTDTLTSVEKVNHDGGGRTWLNTPGDLVEDGSTSSVVTLSETVSVASLAGAGWTDQTGGVYHQGGDFGTATLNLNNNTVSYFLTNTLANGLAANQFEKDEFSIPFTGGDGDVLFAIEGTNDAPTLTGDLLADVQRGEIYTLTTADLNFTDPDDGPGDVTFTVTNQSRGAVRVNGNLATAFTGTELAAGDVTFTQNGTNNPSASFDVSVEDGDEDNSPPAEETFNFAVQTNAVPETDDDLGKVAQYRSVNGNVLTNDTDDDDDALTVTDIDGGTVGQALAGDHGTLILNANGSYTYVANSVNEPLAVGDTVEDVFTYTASDGTDGAAALLTIEITGASTGTSAANHLEGSDGRNTLRGLNGNDRLDGVGGNDTLIGGNGNDRLEGKDGNDMLIGGRGKDLLYGDDGSDRFEFDSIKDSKKGGQRDQIRDFDRGPDEINLRTIDATKNGSGSKFKWIGKDDFSDTKGELRYKDNGSKVIVQGDVNGDGKADFEIWVGVGALSKGDFVL